MSCNQGLVNREHFPFHILVILNNHNRIYNFLNDRLNDIYFFDSSSTNFFKILNDSYPICHMWQGHMWVILFLLLHLPTDLVLFKWLDFCHFKLLLEQMLCWTHMELVLALNNIIYYFIVLIILHNYFKHWRVCRFLNTYCHCVSLAIVLIACCAVWTLGTGFWSLFFVCILI